MAARKSQKNGRAGDARKRTVKKTGPKGMTRGARPRTAAQTRALILETADRLFGAQGYDRTGSKEIATAAGVAEGTIFYHFGSKAGLLDVLGRRFNDNLMTALSTFSEHSEDLTGRLLVERAFAHVERFGLRHDRFGLPIDSPELKHFWEIDRTIMLGFLTDLFARWQDMGRLSPAINVPLAAELAHAVLRDSILTVYARGRYEQVAAYREETIRFLEGALNLPRSDPPA